MKRYFAWALVIINSLIVVIRLIWNLSSLVGEADPLTEAAGFVILTVTFSIMGMIIIVRAEGNRVG